MRSLFWICAALVVISGVMSIHLWSELRAERELIAALRGEVQSAARLEIELAQAPPAAPESNPAAVAVEPPAVAAPELTGRRIQPARDYAVEQRELWEDPEYRKARVAQARAQASLNHPGLAAELGLSAAGEGRLLDLLAEFDVNMSATVTGMTSAANGPAGSQQIDDRLTEVQGQRDAAIAAMLGADGFARWQQYQQSSTARSQANAMNTMLSQAGQPLDATQLRALTATMAAQQQRRNEAIAALTRNVNSGDPAARAQLEPQLRRLQEEYDQRMLSAAAPHLSAQQIELLRAQNELQSALSLARERARDRAAAARQQGAR